jgi:Double zinc ribbon
VTASLHSIVHSTAFTLTRDIVLGGVLVFWFGFAFWTYRDAKRRIDDPWLVGTATLLGLVPFVGPLAYLLFRPPETLEDRHARYVELQALESRTQRTQPACPVCRSAVEPAFLVCPVCTTQLKEQCVSCKAPLEPLWQVCPYCRTPAVAVAVDLDAALTAEVKAVPSSGNGKAPKRAARRATAR